MLGGFCFGLRACFFGLLGCGGRGFFATKYVGLVVCGCGCMLEHTIEFTCQKHPLMGNLEA